MHRWVIFLVGALGLGLIAACGGGQVGIPVYFQSDRDGQWEIYSIWHDGTNLKRLTNDPADDTYPEVTYEGTKLAFLRTQGGVTDIWTMNVDGTNQRNVTNGKAGGQVTSVAWFPGGSQLALAMSTPNVAGGRSQVYSVKEDGTGMTRISKQDDMIYLAPRVHPLGGQLAVAVGPTEAALDIHILQTNGEFIRNVPRETFRALERGFDESTDTNPDFDSTGRSVIFQTNITGPWVIFRVEGDGRKPTKLTKDGATWNETEPSWTGELERLWYAFVSDADGNLEIYLGNMGTGEIKRLTNSPSKDSHPSWVKTPPATQ
ncbi:MAG: PD40 domain-containing protein [Chloroflexi bacterium]|nr:PD40 domain-containing protein [Chloroflexota bacterium]